jgi:RNA polymerase sigma factor (TIGR02999 family)
MTSTLDVLLASADQGDLGARDELFAALYKELHGLARRELSRQAWPANLGVTTLLHEAYLVIAERSGTVFPDRARFMAYAARVMRGLIIDDMRRRLAQKRGGGSDDASLATGVARREADPQVLERISDGLDELATHDPTLAEIVDLKFFCGFSFAEIAAMRGVSERTVRRGWDRSRVYLHRVLATDGQVL